MAVRCPNCGREFDISLFQFGRKVICDCKNIVEFKGWHPPKRKESSKKRIKKEI